MTKKPKESKKAAKGSKRSKIAAQPEEETETATITAPADIPQATPAIPEAEVAAESQQVDTLTAPASPTMPGIPESEVAVDSQQSMVAADPAAPATPTTPSNPITRSEAAKANIKEGLRLHQIAGRPTKAQLILVFGKAGYLLTWPKRTEKFGITPETFQAALAKGVPAAPLPPVAKPTGEKTKEST
jgi:hypothetical protein